MKIVCIILCVALLASGCYNNNKPEDTGALSQRHTLKTKCYDNNKPEDTEPFLQLFKPVQADTFYLESASDDQDVEKAGFKGQTIDASLFNFINDSMTMGYGENGLKRLHACYRFHMSDNVWGLVLRGPSQYTDSSIRIFLFDKKKGTTINNLEVANEFADAGDSYSKGSLLIREKTGWKVIVFTSLCYWEDPADLDDDTCLDSTYVYQISATGFQEIVRMNTDTIKDYQLLRRFSGLSH